MSMAPSVPAGFSGLPPIPAINTLAERDQWVAWKWDKVRGSEKLTKIPVSARTGFNASSTTPGDWSTLKRVTMLACQRRYAGVGFVLSEDDDFVGIDLDDCIDDDGVVAGWADEILCLQETYAEITPSGRGLRLFARGAEGVATKALKRAGGGGVEVYTRARFLTVTGAMIGAVDAINHAPRTLAKLNEIAGESHAAKAERRETFAPSLPPRMIDTVAPLSEIEDLLSRIPASCGYTEWITALMAVHAATGGSAAGEDLAIQWSATGGSQYDGPESVRAKWRSFRRQGVSIASLAEMARGHGADLTAITLAHRAPSTDNVIDFSGLVIGARSRAQSRQPTEPEIMPEAAPPRNVDWHHPAGVMADLTDWILATSRRPNRPLAVGAAIAIVATVAGRHIATPTGCGTHLYIACVGPTSIGKDRPQKAIARVLRAFGRPELAQTGKFMSGSAVEKTVAETPCCCAVVDEMGQALFGRAGHKRASTHEAAIFSILRELWSTSFEPFSMSRRAGDTFGASATVYAPAMTIYGASTDQQFYDSLGAHVVEDGTLNRFTLIKAGPRSDPVEYDLETAQTVPERIVQALQGLLPMPPDRSSQGVNFATGMDVFAPHAEPQVRTVRWASDAVRDRFKAFEASILDRADRNPEIGKFIGRTSEMAVRLATIHALSALGADAVVRLHDLEWGIALAEQSASDMFDDVSDRLADNDFQASYQLVKRLMMEMARDDWIKRRDLTRRLKGRIERRKLDDILHDLAEGEFVMTRPITREITRADGTKATQVLSTEYHLA